MSNVVGSIPEFTTDESIEEGVEEVKQPVTEEVAEETETPTELPAEEEKTVPTEVVDDNTAQIDPELLKKEVERATQGLRGEIVTLRQELASARGNDRKLIQQKIDTAEQKIDDLADVNPADVALIEKVIKSKGYMTKQEAQSLSYQTSQKQILDTFLNDFPEYKPENDPSDTNWKALNAELSLYRLPDDPSKIRDILMRAHKAIRPQSVSDRSLPVKQRAIKVASSGAGGVQRSSSAKTLDATTRLRLADGGFSEEDIQAMENRLE